MARAGSLFIDLGLESATFIAGINKASKETSKAMASIRRSINLASGAMAAFGASKVIGGLKDMADGWSDMSSRMGLAVKDMAAAPAMMREIVQVADRTYSSLNDTAEAFIANRRALADMGVSVRDTVKFTEALGNAMVVSGAKGQRAETAYLAINKAMAVGRLDTKGLETVLANSGRVAEALAGQLGTTVSGLRALAKEGKITGQVILDAMLGNFEKLRTESESMPATISDGFLKIRNAVQAVVGEFDQASNVSQTIGAALSEIGRSMTANIPTILRGLQMVTSAVIGLTTVIASKYALAAGYTGVKATIAFVAAAAKAPAELLRMEKALGAATTGQAIMGVASKGLTFALRGLRTALLSLGLPALVLGVTFVVDKFFDLVRATGGVGAAFREVWNVAKVYFGAVGDYLSAIIDRAKGAALAVRGIFDESARAQANALFQQAAAKQAQALTNVVNVGKTVWAKIREGANEAAAAISGIDDKTKDLADGLGGAGKAAEEAAKKMRDAFASLQDTLFPDEAKWKAYRTNMKLIADAAAAGVKMEHSAEELQRAARGKLLDDLGIARIGPSIAAARAELDKMGDAILTNIHDRMGSSLDDIAKTIDAMGKKMVEPMERAQAGAERLNDLLVDGVMHSGDIGKALIRSFEAAALSGAFRTILNALRGVGGSLINKALGGFAGARASGGPVARGRMYLVGEKGPEAFVAPSAGQIISNESLGNGGTVINIDARQASDPNALQQAVAAAFAMSRQYTDSTISGAVRMRLRVSGGAV